MATFMRTKRLRIVNTTRFFVNTLRALPDFSEAWSAMDLTARMLTRPSATIYLYFSKSRSIQFSALIAYLNRIERTGGGLGGALSLSDSVYH